jgi:phospholipid transport system substrate-binding protein
MKKITMKKLCCIMLSFLWLVNIAHAEANSGGVANPVTALSKTADQMIAELKAQKGRIHNNPKAVYPIIQRVLLPQVDMQGMARSVLGRRIWTSMSPQQKSTFSNEFTRLVIMTYSAALANYNDEQIRFYPMREDFADQSRVEVRSNIIRSRGPSIPVSYRLVRIGSGWKVYDFSVEGISMIRSFQSQFAEQLRQGDIDKMIASLKQHNQTKT